MYEIPLSEVSVLDSLGSSQYTYTGSFSEKVNLYKWPSSLVTSSKPFVFSMSNLDCNRLPFSHQAKGHDDDIWLNLLGSAVNYGKCPNISSPIQPLM